MRLDKREVKAAVILKRELRKASEWTIRAQEEQKRMSPHYVKESYWNHVGDSIEVIDVISAIFDLDEAALWTDFNKDEGRHFYDMDCDEIFKMYKQKRF